MLSYLSLTAASLFATLICFADVPNKDLKQGPALSFVEPNQEVMGVNVINGRYTSTAIDENVKGEEPLQLMRSFTKCEHNLSPYHVSDSPNLGGWYLNFNYLLLMSSPSKKDAYLADPVKGWSKYFLDPITKLYFFDFSALRGITNCDRGVLSGITNPINLKIATLQDSSLLGAFKGDGTVSYFKKIDKLSPPVSPTLLMETYFMEHQKRPSGRYVSNTFDDKGRLKEIKSSDRDGSHIFAALRFRWNEKGAEIKTSDDRTFEYRYTMVKQQGQPTYPLLTSVIFPDGYEEKYAYTPVNQKDAISSVELPGGRKTVFEYQGKQVHKILQSIDASGKLRPIAIFDYRPGVTEVTNESGCLTKYFYNTNEQITAIEHYCNNEKQKGERFYYDGINLIAIAQEDGKGDTILFRSFAYDGKGNVIEERLYGNLTGNQKNAINFVSSLKPNEKTTDCYTRRFSYSNNVYNLLLSESDGVGKTVYQYQHKTDLPIAKFVYDEKGIRLRVFWEYDSRGILVKTIEDDGYGNNPTDFNGCTERKITLISSNKKNFLPETIEEKCFDFERGEEVPVKKTVRHYNSHNDLVRQDIYDADGTLAYSLKKEYDVRGRCVSETDPEGAVTKYSHDVFGNLTEKSGPRSGEKSRYGYDFSHRLIYANENGRESHFKYDIAGNKVSEKIASKGETQFHYNTAKERVEEILPDGSSIKRKYNLYGDVIEEQRGNGEIILTDYNSRGQPIKTVLISNGKEPRVEEWRYDLRGNLAEHISPNGLATYFTYDFLDRLIKKEEKGTQGEVLATYSSEFNGFHLIKEKDPEGNERHYFYDAAGRVRREQTALTQTAKLYDAWGRLESVKKWFGDKEDDYTVTYYQYDKCGRIVGESVEDARGNVFLSRNFDFDQKGNCISEKDGKNGVRKTQYDLFDRPTRKIDSTGLETKYSYEETPISLKIRMTAPSGTLLETVYNARGWVESVQKKNKDDEVIYSEIYTYDSSGNKIEEVIEGIAAKEGQKKIVNRFAYAPGALLLVKIEDAEGPQPRKAEYTYDKAGQLLSKKQGEQSVKYSYDSLGRKVKEIASSSSPQIAPVETTISYDRNNQIISTVVQCGEKNNSTLRKYNEERLLVSEKQGSGLQINYRYDRQGRKTGLSLPDGSEIRYEYKGPFLNRARVMDNKGDEVCRYEIVARDLRGKITGAKLIGSAGDMKWVYDSEGRVTAIDAPGYTSKLKYDVSGNITDEIVSDYLGDNKASYRYDCSQQLLAEKGAFNHSYTYDGLLRRSTKDKVKYAWGLHGQLLSDGEVNYAWDRDGHLQKYQGASLAYDALSRIILYANGKEEFSYAYDSFGRRIGKNGERYLYDGEVEIAAYDDQNRRVAFRVFADDPDCLVALELKGKFYAPLQDVHGSIVSLIEPKKGEVVSGSRFSVFGEEKVFDKKLLSPWRFWGLRTDEESGLLLSGNRYYAPNLGYFINAG